MRVIACPAARYAVSHKILARWTGESAPIGPGSSYSRGLVWLPIFRIACSSSRARLADGCGEMWVQSLPYRLAGYLDRYTALRVTVTVVPPCNARSSSVEQTPLIEMGLIRHHDPARTHFFARPFIGLCVMCWGKDVAQDKEQKRLASVSAQAGLHTEWVRKARTSYLLIRESYSACTVD